MQMNTLLPGTIVSVPIGPLQHVGIVSDRGDLGGPYIISCSRRAGGVAEEPAETFANGANIEVHGYPSSLSPFEVITRARSQLGSKYDPFSWNCEHFVRWAHDLKQESPQLQAVTCIAVLALSVLLRRQQV